MKKDYAGKKEEETCKQVRILWISSSDSKGFSKNAWASKAMAFSRNPGCLLAVRKMRGISDVTVESRSRSATVKPFPPGIDMSI